MSMKRLTIPEYREYENCESWFENHIKQLHDYNACKDAGQLLLGRLAVLEQTTVRKKYDDYELDFED
jgi:hypothetical protein